MQAGPVERLQHAGDRQHGHQPRRPGPLSSSSRTRRSRSQRCGRPADASSRSRRSRRGRWSSAPGHTRASWSSAASVSCGIARERLIGSAPEALAASVRALVALQTNGSVRDVALTVLGVPPAHAVVNWDDATIGGFAATRVLDEPTLRRLSAQVAPLWPPGPHVARARRGRSGRGSLRRVAANAQLLRRAGRQRRPTRTGRGITGATWPAPASPLSMCRH